MSSRKITVARKTKEADETMLARFRDYCHNPYTDELLDFKLVYRLTHTYGDILCDLIKAAKPLVGLFLIAVRCL